MSKTRLLQIAVLAFLAVFVAGFSAEAGMSRKEKSAKKKELTKLMKEVGPLLVSTDSDEQIAGVSQLTSVDFAESAKIMVKFLNMQQILWNSASKMIKVFNETVLKRAGTNSEIPESHVRKAYESYSTEATGNTLAAEVFLNFAYYESEDVREYVLDDLIESRNPVERALAVHFIGEIDTDNEDVTEEDMTDNIKAVRETLAKELKRKPGARSELLLKYIVTSLGKLRDKESADAMLDIIRNPSISENMKTDAVLSLGQLGLAKSVKPLIDHMKSAVGDYRGVLNKALVMILNVDMKRNVKRWSDWYDKEKDNIADRPDDEDPYEEVVEKEFISYCGIKEEGERIIFVIDTSGSMQDQASNNFRTEITTGGDEEEGEKRVYKGRSKWELTQEETKYAIGDLGPNAYFNMVLFTGSVYLWRPRMTLASEENKQTAFAYIDKWDAVGATNIFDALELALVLGGPGVWDTVNDPEVETIFFLSDGNPNMGRYSEFQAIVDEVSKLNKQRKVIIHAVGLGIKKGEEELMEFLMSLASANGGQFKGIGCEAKVD